MNYIYIGKGDFSDPEEIIVEDNGNYFIRHRTTDWDILDYEEKEKILNGIFITKQIITNMVTNTKIETALSIN